MWHSKFYLDNIKYNNDNYQFFDPNTFGIDIYEDPCEPIKNINFKNKINIVSECIGLWCVNKSFNCKNHMTQECYNVEHIIDTKGMEFKDPSCKNIAGNLVMAYGRWNSQLGARAKYHYDDNMNEKNMIYGNRLNC